MTVLSSALAWAGAVGSHELSGAEYMAHYNVTTDDANDQAQTVIQWFRLNVLELGAAYSYAGDTATSKAVAKRIRADRRPNSAFVWSVVVDYGAPETGDGQDDFGNETAVPTDWRPRISARTSIYQRPTYLAIFRGGIDGFVEGNTYVPQNSAFQPIEPPLQKDDARQLVTIERFLTTYDATDDAEEANQINSDAFKIEKYGLTIEVPKRTAKITETQLSFERINGFDVWRVIKGFERDAREWVEEVPDKGTLMRISQGDPGWPQGQQLPDDDLPGVVPIRDALGEPITEPVFLDGSGRPLPEGSAPVLVKWQKYEETAFFAISFWADILDAL